MSMTGILSAVRRQRVAFDETDLDVLVAVAGYLAAALEAAQLHERFREQATTDGLTGLANHRALRRALERELARSRRSGQPVSVVFVEIDGFKKINDEFGHLHGDQIPRAVATVLRGSCRDADLAGRFGGDEFVGGRRSRHVPGQAGRGRPRTRHVRRIRYGAAARAAVQASAGSGAPSPRE